MLVINPGRVFEQNFEKGGVCIVKDRVLAAVAATNNQLVVTAVSGKALMVIGGIFYSAGIATTLLFKSASGGASRYNVQVPVNTAATPNVFLPFNEAGYFRTVVGEGIYVDNTAAVVANISINYIEYVV